MELVVSTILIGFCLAAIGELVALNTFASTKLTNKIDGQLGCSRAIRRLCDDVRQARAIGNIYSKASSNTFPDVSPDSVDPNIVPPAAGYPAPPWSSIPYVLNARTLIIQQPVLYQDISNNSNPLNGFPVRMEPGSVSTTPQVPSTALEYVDTVVYHLVADPDPELNGQYVLQMARFSGFPLVDGCKLRPAINPPQTVLKGIVGPLDASGLPCVFQYLRSAQESSPISTPDASQIGLLAGVSINFEVKVPNTKLGTNPEIATAHAEAFPRSGRFMRLTND
jgi:hypothetical protein